MPKRSLLAVVLLVVYLAALEAWPVGQARALVFTALLASQPVLLLSMRSPDRPLWTTWRTRTLTLDVVIAVVAAATVAVVYVPPLAELLHLEPFPATWWAAVVAVAASAAWSEPLKRKAAG